MTSCFSLSCGYKYFASHHHFFGLQLLGRIVLKQKWCLVVDVSGIKSIVWCCKEQYYIGTWNVRPMNQGKLKLVKQKVARVNIDILGISELKWMGMGEFNSDDHYIYYCGQEFHGRNVVALIINKRVWNAALGCKLKNDRMGTLLHSWWECKLIQTLWRTVWRLLWYRMVCLENVQRSFFYFWDCTQLHHFGLLLAMRATYFL